MTLCSKSAIQMLTLGLASNPDPHHVEMVCSLFYSHFVCYFTEHIPGPRSEKSRSEIRDECRLREQLEKIPEKKKIITMMMTIMKMTTTMMMTMVILQMIMMLIIMKNGGDVLVYSAV